jgi:hypothetical protein
MSETGARVVRVLVDAPGEGVIALFIATTETTWDIYNIISEALGDREMLAGGYPPGQEIPHAGMLEFVLNQFKDWKPGNAKPDDPKPDDK